MLRSHKPHFLGMINDRKRDATIPVALTTTGTAGDVHDEDDNYVDDSNKTSSHSMSVLFVEEVESLQCIDRLSELLERDAAMVRLRAIFDRYLESPTLLDQSLEKMVNKLSQRARQILHSTSRHGASSDSETSFLSLQYHLSALYCLSKVRGRKCVQRFFPYGVDDVEPVWHGLQKVMEMETSNKESYIERASSPQTITMTPLWESTYVLWIWMAGLSLVPFDCRVVLPDSNIAEKLVVACQQYLSDVGPVRQVVASCLASWLSRPDFEAKQKMSLFVDWAQHQLRLYINHQNGTSDDSVNGTCSPSGLEALGLLQTLTAILKVSSVDRERLVEQMRHLWEIVMNLAEVGHVNDDFLLLKQLVKWWTRMSCAFLRPRATDWRNMQGRRSLFGALNQQLPSLNEKPVDIPVGDECGELFDIPDEVEDAVGRTLEALSHASTVIRWSAAKGIGRMTERLPTVCADDVLDAILLLVSDEDNDRCWHGACLALAELARRGLLSPKRLPHIVPVIIKAVHYERFRGKTSVGAHVRDAACYTFWACARAYKPEILRPYVTQLSGSIILASLFDREVNCRRAASAAFQEAVGRQGATSFPHGIEILTTADYFSLGNRTNSYLIIAIEIAKFDEHRRCITHHVHTTKLFHWDPSIRILASKCLQRLAILDIAYACDSVLSSLLPLCLDEKNLHVRHGAVLGVAEVICAISEARELCALSASNRCSIIDLVPAIEKKRLYRGRGGEIMRSAVCRLIECICSAQLPLHVKEQVRFLDSVESNIPHPSESIQSDACLSLKAIMISYFPVGINGPSERLQNRVVDRFCSMALSSDNPAVARGYALALGHLPAKLLATTDNVFASVLRCLEDMAKHTAVVGGESDAATRRNSLTSLILIARSVGFRRDLEVRCPQVVMDSAIFSRLIAVNLQALQDYRTDRRGDVGSWCRLEGIRGINDLVIAATNCPCAKPFLSDTMGVVVIGALLKQVSEKLDTVRQQAGDTLQRLLLLRAFEILEDGDALLQALDVATIDTSSKIWSDPSLAFPAVMKAASIRQHYFECILEGMVTSIGGLTESVRKHASASLLQWAKEGKQDRRLELGVQLLKLLNANIDHVRLFLPIMKTLSLLISHGCFTDIVRSSKDFASQCQCIIQQNLHSTDVTRLFANLDVAVSLLLLNVMDEVVSRKMMGFLCKMLSHPYPRVRSYAAQQFYLFLLERDEQGSAEALEIVLHTPWKSELLDDYQRFPREVADRLNVLFEFSNIS